MLYSTKLIHLVRQNNYFKTCTVLHHSEKFEKKFSRLSHLFVWTEILTEVVGTCPTCRESIESSHCMQQCWAKKMIPQQLYQQHHLFPMEGWEALAVSCVTFVILPPSAGTASTSVLRPSVLVRHWCIRCEPSINSHRFRQVLNPNVV